MWKLKQELTSWIELGNRERRRRRLRRRRGIGAEEERDASFVEEESSNAELEEDLRPGFGVVDAHEGIP